MVRESYLIIIRLLPQFAANAWGNSPFRSTPFCRISGVLCTEGKGRAASHQTQPFLSPCWRTCRVALSPLCLSHLLSPPLLAWLGYRASEKYYKQDAHVQPQASSPGVLGTRTTPREKTRRCRCISDEARDEKTPSTRRSLLGESDPAQVSYIPRGRDESENWSE